MPGNSLKQAMQKIRKTVRRLLAFERNFPKMLKGADESVRPYLLDLRQSLPDLKHLIRYAADSVPTVASMTGLADQGMTDLSRASEILDDVRQATEKAVNDIFDVMDRVDPLLEKVAQSEGMDEEVKQALEQAREELMLILGALQFQDITSQQIEATNALLAKLGESLITLVEGGSDENLPQIEVREGTYDPNASFNRTITQ